MLPYFRHLSLFPGGLAVALGLLIPPAGATASTPERVESYRWSNVVIRGGGLVTGLVFHPTQRDLLYARTDVGGAYRWDSARDQWQPLNDNLGPDEAEWLGVLSLALDPHNDRLLYLACGSYLEEWSKPAAIFRSADQGETWQRTELPLKLGGNQDGRTAGERLVVDPHLGRVLLLGSTQDGLWRSSDQAVTWTRVAAFPAARLTVVLFDPRSGADGAATPAIYAGANDPGGPALYASRDAGQSWSPVPGQPAGLLIQHAALDAAGVLYLTYADGLGPNGTTRGAVWKLETATGHWTNITPVAPDPATGDKFSYAGLALDAQQPGTLLVGTLDRWKEGDEIFRSRDGGVTWHRLLARSTWDYSSAPYIKMMKPHWIGGIALDPFASGRALFETGYGIWLTSHADNAEPGVSVPWRFAANNLEETVVSALVSPPAGAPLLSALWDVGGFRHDDFAHSPPAGTYAPAHGNNPSLDFAELAPNLMVRTHSGPTRGAVSHDGGATWQDFRSAPASAIAHGPGMAAISADGRRLVWLPKGSPPYYSTDDGGTWTKSQGDLQSTKEWTTYGPAADRVNPGKFYIYESLTGRICVSADGGATFVRTETLPIKGGTLKAEPGREGSVWVPTPQGLYHSTDSGRTFRRLGGIDAARQIGFGRAITDGAAPAIFLAGRIAGTTGVFRSDDGGGTWARLTDARLQFGWIAALTGDPRVPGRVYLGTGGRGIFVGEPGRP